MKYKVVNWYDYPKYYDVAFQSLTSLEVPFLVDIHKTHCESGGLDVLEPACGSGRLVEAMSALGYSVTGFDSNSKMLEYAKIRTSTSSNVTLLKRNLEHFRCQKQFDTVHCLANTIRYLDSDSALLSHLDAVENALKLGGVYVLGLHLTDYSRTARTRERWVGCLGDLRVVCNIQGWPPDRTQRAERFRSRLIVDRGKVTTRLETEWHFRTYSASEICDAIQKHKGLELVASYGFDYSIEIPSTINEDTDDCVLVLRRKRYRQVRKRPPALP